jgi:hypothetical protein
MLRLQSNTGWWLVTHVDHARLAGMFAILALPQTTVKPRRTLILSNQLLTPEWI